MARTRKGKRDDKSNPFYSFDQRMKALKKKKDMASIVAKKKATLLKPLAPATIGKTNCIDKLLGPILEKDATSRHARKNTKK